MSSDDPIFGEFSGDVRQYLFFDDVLFDGEESKIDLNTYIEHIECAFVSTDPKCENELEVTLYIRKVSEDYFRYKETAELQDQLTDDPFLEPVSVYSNIDNGYGIFAGFRVSAYPIEIPEE